MNFKNDDLFDKFAEVMPLMVIVAPVITLLSWIFI
jgi:hypothetical protein